MENIQYICKYAKNSEMGKKAVKRSPKIRESELAR